MTKREFKTANTNFARGQCKINNSWGVYDYYKYYRTHRPDEHQYVLYESVYFAIIRRVNKYLAEELCRTGEITFPHRMGGIKIFAKPVKTWIDNNGKPRTTKSIDWDKTWDLWYEDEQAFKNKYVVYRDSKDVPKIVYDKHSAIYKNKYYYDFKVCRELKTKILKWFDAEGRFKLNHTFERASFKDIKGLYDD